MEKKSRFKSTHNAFPLGDLLDKKQPGWGSDPCQAGASSLSCLTNGQSWPSGEVKCGKDDCTGLFSSLLFWLES